MSLESQHPCQSSTKDCTEIVFSMAVCSSFCDSLWDACNGVASRNDTNSSGTIDPLAFCYGATDGEDCCKRLGKEVTVVAGNGTEDDCYNEASRAHPGLLVAVGAVVMANVAVAI